MAGLARIIFGVKLVGISSMRKLIFLALALFTYVDVKAQSFTQDKLMNLMPYFVTCKTQGILEEMPAEEFSSDLIQEIFAGNPQGQLELYAVCAKQYEFGTLLFLKTKFPKSESYNLEAILVYTNGYYKTQDIGDNTNNLDETANTTVTSMLNDTIIQLIQSKYDFDFTNELERNYQYFLVDECGILHIAKGEYSDKRRFIECSVRILVVEYLNNFSKRELDIMRNEIFADHGYKFKSKKWQKYFCDKEWYKPRYDDVNNRLTNIEKINIQLILAASTKLK